MSIDSVHRTASWHADRVRREQEIRDREAEGYRERYRREKGAWWDDLETELLTRPVRTRRGVRVLDAGAGVGRISVALGRAGCEVSAVDLSLVSLRTLRDEARSTEAPIRAVVADLAGAVPFARNTHHAAVSGQAIHHIPTRSGRVAAWRELARVCMPDAILAVTVYHRKPWQSADGVWPNGPPFHRYTVPDLGSELTEGGWWQVVIRRHYRFESRRLPYGLARALDLIFERLHVFDDRATYLSCVARRGTPRPPVQ